MRALHFRILLRTFAAGLAVVWLIGGLNIAWRDVPVQLPESKSTDALVVFPRNGGRIWFAGCCNYPHGDYETLASLLGIRDMRLYEDGGDHSSPCFHASAAEPDCGESLAYTRKFIWSHWHNKIRGYLRITFCAGDYCTEAHLFIEPDKNGDWRVARYYDRGCDLDDARFERVTDITKVRSNEQPRAITQFLPEYFS